MSQLLKVQCFNVSLDGFGAGDGQTLDHPFGHANPADLMSWAGATASWANRTDPGGTRGLDDYFTRDMPRNIGAEIMGRNKFGPQRGPWENLDWEGWWGDTPPFHTPVFVLTHHHRPSFTLADTTFHFIDATPSEALQQATAAADGPDVRLRGGGATTADPAWCGGAEPPPLSGCRPHPHARRGGVRRASVRRRSSAEEADQLVDAALVALWCEAGCPLQRGDAVHRSPEHLGGRTEVRGRSV